ncbi:hypothetical protein NYL07_12610 [Xanthomonas translucens pv. translucens]|uniref:hypothetical protein n=1 Tax=Xanthomonas campestris pv. translucens TaxID=343 RepID=UPI0007624989|nr:hypothetical protein [Xanthomonas translucens]KWV17079.1 hypothetical protein ATB54_00135 [Xanthomonas translucens]MCS3360670.1 hypothetical protein [Xanthomonas translucens pv. translucens]MCS3373298.1 hypothetical protein [Xanthomonas translucens pv. translucens]MCT8290247.1 hypothetical protein [Xanthomonas translucens pv. translucens]MCT8293929.1 hypothetical protein [Xanthomonas translucens pv. translucens]
MHHEIQIIALVLLALACLVRGTFAFLRFQKRHFMQRMDAEFRATALVQESKRYVDRVTARQREVFYDPYD